MAVTKHLSRTLATCLAACAAAAILALCSPVRALAQQTGNLTVTATEGASTKLRAYQLFSGDVTDVRSGSSSEKVIVDVSWASKEAEEAVTSAIKSAEPGYRGTTAEDASEWLRDKVQGDKDVAPEAGSVPAAVARALSHTSGPAYDVTAGETVALPEGYWLVVSDDGAVGTGQSGTAAILALVGGADVTATTKAAAPTVEKQVLEDSGDAWQKQADATVADELDWRLVATVPVDLTAYASYSVTFHDVLSAGIAEPSGVRVYVASLSEEAWGSGTKPGAKAGWTELVNADPNSPAYTTSYDPSGDEATFELTVADLRRSAEENGIDVSAGIRVCVVYDAPLTQDAERGVEHGNPNTVTLRYPASPYTDARGETQEDEAIAYTWDLDLVKRSSLDEKPLAGAVLRVTDDRGWHLTQEGTWTSDDATVTTGEDGTISAAGVDSGTFKVEEVKAPAGYVGVTDRLEVRLSVSLEADRISHHLEKAADPEELSPGEWALVATKPLELASFDPDASGVATAFVPNAPAGEAPPQGGGGGSVAEALRRALPRTPFTGDPTSFVPVVCLAAAGVALIAFAIRRMRGGREDRR